MSLNLEHPFGPLPSLKALEVHFHADTAARFSYSNQVVDRARESENASDMREFSMMLFFLLQAPSLQHVKDLIESCPTSEWSREERVEGSLRTASTIVEWGEAEDPWEVVGRWEYSWKRLADLKSSPHIQTSPRTTEGIEHRHLSD